ncbi:MAG TPA: hypothetical protein VGQ39_04945 [Pyrinomonadaceae bacterium]|jgi:hypothetical protein|nr:hypothetical protein [Pyrinomonadaceae bacterium]
MSQVNSRESVGNHKPNVLKGLAAGTIGELVASWVMNELMIIINNLLMFNLSQVYSLCLKSL